MIVRNANVHDVEQIKLLIDRNFDEVISKYHSPDIVVKFKEYNSINNINKQLTWKKIYVAEDNGCIVGTGAFANFGTKETPKYCISNLYVMPELHGKGIGTLIVNVLFENAKENNAYSFCVPSTRNAMPFYMKCGFVVDKLQPDIKDEVTWMSMVLDYTL